MVALSQLCEPRKPRLPSQPGRRGWPGAIDPALRTSEMKIDEMAVERIFPLGGKFVERRDKPQYVGHSKDASSGAKGSSGFSISSSSSSQLTQFPRRFGSQSRESATMSLVT